MRGGIALALLLIGLADLEPARAAGAPSRATSARAGTFAAPSTFVALTPSPGIPKALSDADEVLGNQGVWRNGTLVTPAPVPGAVSGQAAMTLNDMSPDGLVVGGAYQGDLTSSGGGNEYESHSVYWQSRTTTTPQFYPAFTDQEQGSGTQCPGYGDSAVTVDSADVIAGVEDWNSPSTSGPGCMSTTKDFTAPVGGGDDPSVGGQPFVVALEPNWIVLGSGNSQTLGAPGASNPLALPLLVEGRHDIAADGSTAGLANGTGAAAFSDNAGDLTDLPLPSGAAARGNLPYAMNDAHEIVGEWEDSSGNMHAALWPSPTSQPISLQSYAPAGWTLEAATAINALGDIAGWGKAPTGGVGEFLLTVEPPSSTAVACRGASPASTTCTATVAPGNPADTTVPTGSVSFSATGGSFPSGASCTLAPTTGSGAGCSVSYTPPPPPTGSAGPTVTAAYGGDGTYAPSSGSVTLCADGQPLELTSITAPGPRPNGFQVGNDVTLHGCGFIGGMTVQWGNSDATATVDSTEITTGGTLATLPMPWQSTTGDVTISDGLGNNYTLTNQPADSYRNTDGFKFPNFRNDNTIAQMIAAFAPGTFSFLTYRGSGGHLSYQLLGSSLLYWALANGTTDVDDVVPTAHGRCYGFAWVSATMADGTTAVAQFGAASTPWGLPVSRNLGAAISSAWWKQLSTVELAYDAASRQSPPSPAAGIGIHAALTLAFGADGFSHPALLNLDYHTLHRVQGHTVTAFAVRDTPTSTDPGAFTIEVYNSNLPFASQENSSTLTHDLNQSNSEITVSSSGNWVDPEEGWQGTSREIGVVPITALEGPLTVNLPSLPPGPAGDGALARSTAVGSDVVALMSPTTHVISATDPTTGQSANLSGGSGLTVVPWPNDPGLLTATPGPGETGIEALTGPSGTWRDTIAAGHGGLLAMWQRAGGDTASLVATSGADAVRYSPATNGIAVAAPASGRASGTATLSLTQGTTAQRVLTVTGPLARAGVSAVLSGNRSTITAARTATLDVQVAGSGPTGATTYDLGPLRVPAGATLRVSAGSWSPGHVAGLRATLTPRHGRPHRLSIHNHYAAPAATIAQATRNGRALAIRLRLPRALAGSGVVSVTARTGHRRLTATFAVTRAGSTTVTLRLPAGLAAHAAIHLTVTSYAGGTTPGRAVRSQQIT